MNEEETETTDLEYREAAIRLSIQYHKAKGDRPTPGEVRAAARFFEAYLREG